MKTQAANNLEVPRSGFVNTQPIRNSMKDDTEICRVVTMQPALTNTKKPMSKMLNRLLRIFLIGIAGETSILANSSALSMPRIVDVLTRMEVGDDTDDLTISLLNSATSGSGGEWKLYKGKIFSPYEAPKPATSLPQFTIFESHESSAHGLSVPSGESAGEVASSRSIGFWNGASTDEEADYEFARYEFTGKSKVSIGCFVTLGDFANQGGSQSVTYDVLGLDNLGGSYAVLNLLQNQNANPNNVTLYFRLHTYAGVSTEQLQVDANTTYWVTIMKDKDQDGGNGLAKLEVYDPTTWQKIGNTLTLNLRGSWQEVPAPESVRGVFVGRYDNHGYYYDAYHWYDDLAIDFTGTRFPLLPSEASVPNYQLSHSLNDEFTLAGNPISNGRWSYGWKETLNGSFTTLGVQYNGSTGDNSVTIPSWQFSTTQEPVAYWNSTGNTVTIGNGWLSFPSHCVWLYPGQDYEDQNYGVIRYIVPSGEAGIYQIIGGVDAVYKDLGIGDTDFYILKNGTPIYSRDIEEAGDALFTKTTTLSVGDIVDFAIGRGADGSTYASGLKIFADICKVANSGGTYTQNDLNESFGTGSNQGGDWRYGWKETLAGSFTQLTVQHNGSLDDEWNVIPSWQLTSGLEPAVYRNQQSHTVTIGSGLSFVNPHAMWFCAGQDSRDENYGVIRYTVPSGQSGAYQLGVSVQSLYDIFNGGDADFHVLVNGVEIAGQNIQAGGSALHTQTLTLTAGDTVDFAVGRGYEDPLYGSILKIFGEVSRIQ